MNKAGEGQGMTSAHRREPWVCLTRCVGQLGNRLFLSAHALAFARERGVRFANVALAEYADFFQGSQGRWWSDPAGAEDFVATEVRSGGVFPPTPARRKVLATVVDQAAGVLARWGGRRWRALDILQSHDPGDRVFPLESLPEQDWWFGAKGVFLRGWKFRLSGGLERHREFLQSYFTPVADRQRGVDRALAEARRQGEVVLGVHIRRGDYQHWLGGKYFFEHSCYARWMEEAAACWPERRVVFLVCSNEPWPTVWREKFSVVTGPGDAVGDLYALAGCDAILAPPSSFALWASFIGHTPLHIVEDAEQKVHPVTFTFHPGA